MIAEILESTCLAIEKSRLLSPLAAEHVTLIGASKQQPEATLRQAIVAGLHEFGENRVQEAAEKWPALRREFSSVRLHLIGPLQTNKAREAVALFDVIQTVDRVRLADALADEMKKQGRQLECFIEINTGEEPQKAGVKPGDAAALIGHCRDIGLSITGLMCVPPAGANPAPHFALLNRMAKEHKLPNLSMGMSEDFETAVRMGATHVRIGRALFGERKKEDAA